MTNVSRLSQSHIQSQSRSRLRHLHVLCCIAMLILSTAACAHASVVGELAEGVGKVLVKNGDTLLPQLAKQGRKLGGDAGEIVARRHGEAGIQALEKAGKKSFTRAREIIKNPGSLSWTDDALRVSRSVGTAQMKHIETFGSQVMRDAGTSPQRARGWLRLSKHADGIALAPKYRHQLGALITHKPSLLTKILSEAPRVGLLAVCAGLGIGIATNPEAVLSPIAGAAESVGGAIVYSLAPWLGAAFLLYASIWALMRLKVKKSQHIPLILICLSSIASTAPLVSAEELPIHEAHETHQAHETTASADANDIFWHTLWTQEAQEWQHVHDCAKKISAVSAHIGEKWSASESSSLRATGEGALQKFALIQAQPTAWRSPEDIIHDLLAAHAEAWHSLDQSTLAGNGIVLYTLPWKYEAIAALPLLTISDGKRPRAPAAGLRTANTESEYLRTATEIAVGFVTPMPIVVDVLAGVAINEGMAELTRDSLRTVMQEHSADLIAASAAQWETNASAALKHYHSQRRAAIFSAIQAVIENERVEH